MHDTVMKNNTKTGRVILAAAGPGDPELITLKTLRYLQGADVVVRPKLDGVSGTDFSSRRLAVLAGREAMLSQLPQLRARIAALTH